MVLIPPDAGIRLRLPTDGGSILPATPIQEIPSDLPDFRPGQAFTARIQEVLPEHTYKALVAGRSLTLQLPQGANTGDTLELVVIDRTPRAVVAQLAGQPDAAAAHGGAPAYTNLSQAGRMIAALLPAEGEPLRPAPLNKGRPLLPQPPLAASGDAGAPQAPKALASALAQAVGESGLFYEAHVAEWMVGERPKERLLTEPQARHTPAPPAGQNESGTEPAPAPKTAPPLPGPVGNLLKAVSESESLPPSVASKTAETPPAANTTLPEDLRPLVQQQLDAAATHRLVWHGEVWPQQSMEWEIREEAGQPGGSGEDADAGSWRTTLRLVTPRLGEVSATLFLGGSGVRVSLATPYGASAADLRNEAPALASALEAAGVPLIAFQVKHDDGQDAAHA